MSSTRSPSPKGPATEGRWPVWKLAVLLYPAVALTVAINLFMAALAVQVLGWTALSPVSALIWAVPLGVPVTWLAGRWLRKLMDEADG